MGRNGTRVVLLQDKELLRLPCNPLNARALRRSTGLRRCSAFAQQRWPLVLALIGVASAAAGLHLGVGLNLSRSARRGVYRRVADTEVRPLLAERGSRTGTAGTLSDRAVPLVRQRTWPSTPRALGSAVQQLAPKLRAIGIATEFSREPEGRGVGSSRSDRRRERPSRPSRSSRASPPGSSPSGRGEEAMTMAMAEVRHHRAEPAPGMLHRP